MSLVRKDRHCSTCSCDIVTTQVPSTSLRITLIEKVNAVLSASDTGLTPSEISLLVGSPPTVVSRILTRLEREQKVSHRVGTDRRQKIYSAISGTS